MNNVHFFFFFLLLMWFSPRDINILTGLIEPLEVSLCFCVAGEGSGGFCLHSVIGCEESCWSQSHLLSQGHVHVQNLGGSPRRPMCCLPNPRCPHCFHEFVLLFFQVLSRLFVQLRMGAGYLHILALSTGKTNWRGFLCYWSFMDLALQATQPSPLCD